MPTLQDSGQLQADTPLILSANGVDNIFFIFDIIPDYFDDGDFITVDLIINTIITPGIKRTVWEGTTNNYTAWNVPEQYRDSELEICFLPSMNAGSVQVWSFENPEPPCSCQAQLDDLQDIANLNALLNTGIVVNQLAQNAAIEAMAMAQGAAFSVITAGASLGIPAAVTPAIAPGTVALLPLLP